MPSALPGDSLQSMLIGVDGRLIAARQARRVAQQEPQLVVLRCRFHSALGIIGGGAGIAVSQGILGGSRQAANFNTASPTNAVVASCIGLCCRLVLLLACCSANVGAACDC